MRRTAPIIMITAGALALSGCATSSYAGEIPATGNRSAATTTADGAAQTSSAAKTSKTTTSTKTTKTANKPKISVCDAFQLEIKVVDTEAGAGSVQTAVRITNLDIRDACQIPGALHAVITDGTRTLATATPDAGSDKTVVLGSKGSATLIVRTANGTANLPAGQKCTPTGNLLITLPGKPRHSDVITDQATFRSCGGLNVSPLDPSA